MKCKSVIAQQKELIRIVLTELKWVNENVI
jgi:hypothetical protein